MTAPNDFENFYELYDLFLTDESTPIVVDGSNFLYEVEKHDRVDAIVALDTYEGLDDRQVLFIFPEFLLCKKTMKRLKRKLNNVILIPITSKEIEDWVVITLAEQFNGIILSNDKFKDYLDIFPNLLKKLIKFSLFSYKKIILIIPFLDYIHINNQSEDTSRMIAEDELL